MNIRYAFFFVLRITDAYGRYRKPHTKQIRQQSAETCSNWSLITESLFNETHHEPEVRQE